MKTLRDAIDQPIIEATFLDSKTGENKTEEFYGTAIPAKLNNINGRYEPCSFSLKAVSRRDDM